VVGLFARIGPVDHGGFSGDRALIALSVRSVGSHAVLLGPYSRFGWHHPGPFWLYLLALPNLLFGGQTFGLVVGATAINAAAAVGTVVVALRRGGRSLAVWTAVLLGAYVVALGIAPFEVWNPSATILPFALVLVLAWSVACLDTWALPWLAVTGTFCVQTHVGLAPGVIAAVVAAGVGAAVMHRRTPAPTAPPRARCRRVLQVTAVALFVLWLPPLIEQFTSGTGNLSKLVAFFTEQGGHHPLSEGVRRTAKQFTLLPRDLLHQVTGMPARASAALGIAIALTLVAAAVALGVAARARATTTLVLLALIGLEIVVGMFSVTRVVGDVLPYLVQWISAVGLVFWVAAGAAVLPALRESRPAGSRGGRVLLVAAIIAVGAVAVDGLRTAQLPSGLYGIPQLHQVTRPLRAALAGSSHVTFELRDVSAWPLMSGVALDLEQHGVDVDVIHSWATDVLFEPSTLVRRPARGRVVVFEKAGRKGEDSDAVVARADPWIVLQTAADPSVSR
jgi:hypothetical protein